MHIVLQGLKETTGVWLCTALTNAHCQIFGFSEKHAEGLELNVNGSNTFEITYCLRNINIQLPKWKF